MRVPLGLAGLALVTLASPARAQEFDPVLPAGGSALAFVATGLPPANRATRIECSTTRWEGLSELTAGALAVHLARRELHVGLGLAHAGAGELGWSSAALAVGAAGAQAGGGVTAIARRDDLPLEPGTAAAAGLVTGGGAWVETAPGVRVWASDPGVWTSGAAPPLPPALEIGIEARAPGLVAWAARTGNAIASAHRAGLALAAGAAGAWLEARDQPLRGSFGVWTAWRGLTLAARADAHPVLAPTVRMLIAAGAGAW